MSKGSYAKCSVVSGDQRCKRTAEKRGMCPMHYKRWRESGDPGTVNPLKKVIEKLCKIEGCESKTYAYGFCLKHSKRWAKTGDPGPVNYLRTYADQCCVEGCTQPHRTNGYCSMHQQRARKYGNPGTVEPKKRKAGEGHISKSGYKYLWLPSHPNAAKNGKVAEHVVVMCEVLGRPLRKGENVHHKNGIRSDNNPQNLELWVKSQPSGQRVVDRINDAIALLKQYLEDDPLWEADIKHIQNQLKQLQEEPQ